MKQCSRRFRFLGPGNEFMVEQSIYIENIDFRTFPFFQNQFLDDKSISQDGIWITGRPQSRWDPPGPRKTQKKLEKRRFQTDSN